MMAAGAGAVMTAAEALTAGWLGEGWRILRGHFVKPVKDYQSAGRL